MIIAITMILNLLVIGYVTNTWFAYRQTPHPYEDKVKFRQLLKKHGLNCEVTVIYRDPLGPYYIQNNRRYKFK